MKWSSEKSKRTFLDHLAFTAFTEDDLKKILCWLANSTGAAAFRLQWPHGPWTKDGAFQKTFFAEYSDEEVITFRDELRMIWKPPITDHREDLVARHVMDLKAEKVRAAEYEKSHPAAGRSYIPTPQESILNGWLSQIERHGVPPWLAVWNRKQRTLMPGPSCLPSVLVYSVLLFADRLRFCRNRKCVAPYFIASRRDQSFCSPNCAAPAKKAAKRKWWRNNRGADAR